MRIGLDFGGVIVPLAQKRAAGEDTSLGAGSRTPNPGAVDGVRRLIELSSGQLWVISKAGDTMERLTREWLRVSDFYNATGLREEQVRFCRERSDKKPICEELSITHFVDDRIHLMQVLQDTVPHLYRFAAESERRFTPPFATHVSSWADLVSKLAA